MVRRSDQRGARARLVTATATVGFLALGGWTGCTAAATASEADAQYGGGQAGESKSEVLPTTAYFNMNAKLGTGINTAFFSSFDTPCVEYSGGGAGAPARTNWLGNYRWTYESKVLDSTVDLDRELGVKASVSAKFDGLVVGGSVKVDFSLHRQSKVNQNSVYVLVKAWGEADDLSRAGQEPRLTDAALRALDGGPYEFASGCGNNYISNRKLGVGYFLVSKFTSDGKVSTQELMAAIQAGVKYHVFEGQANAEFDMKYGETYKSISRESKFTGYGFEPPAGTVDEAKLQQADPAELAKFCAAASAAMSGATKGGPGTREYDDLATISIQTSPYARLIPIEKKRDLRELWATGNYSRAEMTTFVPDMTPVAGGLVKLQGELGQLATAIGEATELMEPTTRALFNYRDPQKTLTSVGGDDPFGMAPHVARLAADWRAVQAVMKACEDEWGDDQRYASCIVPDCDAAAVATDEVDDGTDPDDDGTSLVAANAPSAPGAYCLAEAHLAAFRSARPERLNFWTSGRDSSYGDAVLACGDWRLPSHAEALAISASLDARSAHDWFWIADGADKFDCGAGFEAEKVHNFMSFENGQRSSSCSLIRSSFATRQYCVRQGGLFAWQ
jgi:hypothetical protein